jgi:hypothetical protein
MTMKTNWVNVGRFLYFKFVKFSSIVSIPNAETETGKLLA